MAQHCDPPLSRYRVQLYLSHLRFSGYRRVSRYASPLGGIAQLFDVLKARGGGLSQVKAALSAIGR